MASRKSLYACLAAAFASLLVSADLHDPLSVPNIYSDIISFWGRSWVAQGSLPYVSQGFEYPTLSGVILYVARTIGGSELGYYYTFTAMSFVSTGVLVWACWKVAKKRGKDLKPLYFLLPSFIIYGIYNFDIFHVTFAMLGLLALMSGKRTSSALALGLAIATKLTTFVLIPVFLLEIREWKGMTKFMVVLLATLAAVNLPFIVANYGNWIYTYTFQRGYGLEEAWYVWIFQNPSTWGAAKSFGLALMGLLLLRVYTLRVDVVTRSYLAITAYLLGTYVYAPQWNLLLIPFAAVLALDTPSMYIWEACNAMIILTWFDQSNPTMAWTIPQEFALVRDVMLVVMTLSLMRREGWSLRSMLPHLRQKTLDPGPLGPEPAAPAPVTLQARRDTSDLAPRS